ncbi:phosphoenolpyruvate carboxylase [Halobacteriovorax sp. HLS]|uniref:phosphoenolpyruvate carboxylase n=1 Tax=Halobacteriovorax sp. HLS TaxID=2234000 RepID=UPI000FD8B42D|nr:phosphoenolpyruvate carboxylase [Halobacteriovorax sp. HLS]
MNNKLPLELKNLVNKVVGLLGGVIEEEAGSSVYKKVEKIRKEMILYRTSSASKKDEILETLYLRLDKENKNDKHQIAHSYTLMLELINACEAAYRTYSLKKKGSITCVERQQNTMVYVLTAHPTEARTPENIELFSRIQNVLIRILNNTEEEAYLQSIIKHNLKLAWLIPITRHESPEVLDEAKHLFSIIMRADIFDTILRADRDLGNVRIRTWVGGDKDGHPGVDEKVMLDCLNASRFYFVNFLTKILSELKKDIDLIGNEELKRNLAILEFSISNITSISSNDGERLNGLKGSLKKLIESYVTLVGMQSPRLFKIESILKLFPGLVIPIELREDSEIIEQALSSDTPIAIERMLRKLAFISKGTNIRNYAQGMIISMCCSFKDVQNAIKLVKKSVGNISLPIIPLFETAQALEDSPEIVNQMIANKQYLSCVKNKWNNRLEVMLGYSDSSKGMGVLPSRVAIAKTLRNLDMIITKASITPVFFHGSGGSIDRGGGSIKDQTAWWPKSALNIYKATIQGEMVERNFNSSEVTLSGINKILENFQRAKTKKGAIKIDKAVEEFSSCIKDHYVEKIEDEKFFSMIEKATPYSYLKVLRLGSRPSKRSKSTTFDFSSIRAIPWILCWTQTRLLFPTWWGVGHAWTSCKVNKTQSAALKKSYKESYIFSSYVRSLGFTLSKVDLSVFKLYLKKSTLAESEQDRIYNEIRKEFLRSVDFVKEITGQKNILWHKPWLAESIQLRSSMIHPLNILQIQGNKNGDLDLVRKTVAGISSGMMTTG